MLPSYGECQKSERRINIKEEIYLGKCGNETGIEMELRKKKLAAMHSFRYGRGGMLIYLYGCLKSSSSSLKRTKMEGGNERRVEQGENKDTNLLFRLLFGFFFSFLFGLFFSFLFGLFFSLLFNLFFSFFSNLFIENTKGEDKNKTTRQTKQSN
jgi:hypothetical protein